MRRDVILSLLVAILLLTTLLAVMPVFVRAHEEVDDEEEVEGEAKLDDPGNNADSPTGVSAKIKFKDDGTTLKITGKAKGLTPGVPYASLIYDIFSSTEGPFACEPGLPPDDPSPLNIFATMFVGFWDVDEDGKGKLSATNIGPTFTPGPPVYVPLSKIGTISIRDTTVIGDFGPGTGPAAVVACGVVDVEDFEDDDDEEKDDKREIESDMNDRFATETGAEGSVEWQAIGGCIDISKLKAKGLNPGHSYEIKVTISVDFPSFDPFRIVTFGPFVANDDGKLKVKDLKISDLDAGNYRVDIFVTHDHATVAGVGPTGEAITALLDRDPLLACQPAFNLDVEEDDDEEEREIESDMNDRFATETGAEGSVEWQGITGGVRISELEAEGLTPGHSYEIIVLIDFDPSLVFTFGPFVADDDGELEVEDLEFTGLASGDHRADVFVTHIHSTVAGTGPTGLLITDLIGRDPLLACQPALFFTA